MVILGIALFTFASLMSGCAMTQEWHIGCRTVQGIGAAIASPTALALVTTNFPQGAPRNKAWGNSVDRLVAVRIKKEDVSADGCLQLCDRARNARAGKLGEATRPRSLGRVTLGGLRRLSRSAGGAHHPGRTTL